jgi:catechol 2,3-dioxygenase-like lactoylglutathione lyase family enzyme
MRLECSMLYVKDFTRMREFYRDMLQSQPINAEWTDTWAFFEVGGTGFALHAIPREHADKTDPSSPPPKRAQAPVKLIFAVEDISAERARLGNGHYSVATILAGTC